MPEAPSRPEDPARRPSEAERERQREIARATAAKIDAIELAMTTDLFEDTSWGNTRRAPAAAAGVFDEAAETELFTIADQPDAASLPASAPVLEESAILYANGQAVLAEQMLQDSLAELGRNERQPWWMLFDLYQLQGREADFESIAIDYASLFETSPPAYTERVPRAMPAQVGAQAGAPAVSPVARFAGMLDASARDRLQALPAAGGAPVRLDFGAVSGASAEGCAALLSTLQSLRGGGLDVVLAGADTLLAVLRPMLAIGERSTGEAPWLLLLELLQLLGREKDFEETAMDYCVTFEVSPPSFEASAAQKTSVVQAATTPDNAAPAAEQRFVLPGEIDGDIAPLLAALDAYAAADPSQPLVLDCGRAARVGFGAAGTLHAGLRRLAGEERHIELRELNHLVAALFRLLNYGDCARLYAHKY